MWQASSYRCSRLCGQRAYDGPHPPVSSLDPPSLSQEGQPPASGAWLACRGLDSPGRSKRQPSPLATFSFPLACVVDGSSKPPDACQEEALQGRGKKHQVFWIYLTIHEQGQSLSDICYHFHAILSTKYLSFFSGWPDRFLWRKKRSLIVTWSAVCVFPLFI